MPYTFRKMVQVIMHLPEGYPKVFVEKMHPPGLGVGAIYLDIQTSVIPPALRRIGSRFLLETTALSGKLEAEGMTAEEIRAALKCRVIAQLEEDV